MLEYQDKKFGKVKLVTVTEARANFAQLLQDKDTHYIITKNNKPIRVIVNYQAFEDLHNQVTLQSSNLTQEKDKKEKKSSQHLSGLLEERSEELKTQNEVSDETVTSEEIDLPPRYQKNPKVPKEQDVFIEDDIAEDILNVFQSGIEAPEQTDEEKEDTVSERVTEEEILQSENYFASGDEDDEASLLHPEHIEDAPSENHLVHARKATVTAVVAETSFPSEADMTPEQRDYFQKYRKLYENPIPKEPLPYDEVTREVEKRLAAKWGKTEFKQTAVSAQNSREAEDAFLADPIPEDPQDPDGLPSLKDLLKDLEHETLSGDDEGKENLDKGDIAALIHRITHDY